MEPHIINTTHRWNFARKGYSQQRRQVGNQPEEDDGNRHGEFASPACYMHELDPAFGDSPLDQQQTRNLAQWRKSQRERLISARLALPVAERSAHSSLIARQLDQIVPFISSTIATGRFVASRITFSVSR